MKIKIVEWRRQGAKVVKVNEAVIEAYDGLRAGVDYAQARGINPAEWMAWPGVSEEHATPVILRAEKVAP